MTPIERIDALEARLNQFEMETAKLAEAMAGAATVTVKVLQHLHAKFPDLEIQIEALKFSQDGDLK